MRLILAPMEGVVDHTMREFITHIGGVDLCVTEFIRVTDQVLPPRVFYRRCPELHLSSKTSSQTPVRVQLLGGDANVVAANAEKAAKLGAIGIDLNFGCPAKTVNKSDGGAVILKSAHRLFDIAQATRQAVPSEIPVTAKMRLGFDDRSRYVENAVALFEAGVTEITVHARSKADGYKPPAYWEYIKEIRQAIPINVIANGDIWNIEDFKRCQAVSGAEDFMLGRGLLSKPDLALEIKALKTGAEFTPLTWAEMCEKLSEFLAVTAQRYDKKYMGNRVKQWLFYLCRNYPQANQLFESIKRSRDYDFIQASIRQSKQLNCKLRA